MLTNATSTNKWQERYLDLAKEVSTWSRDPSRKIGAVAIGNHGQVLSQGYNGFPRNIQDLDSRYQNRTEKYKYVVHAEMNCIYNATINGVSLENSTLYVWGLPVCSECCKGIIQVGIKQVYWGSNEAIPENWMESYNTTYSMLAEAQVGIECIHTS